jgi:hypothetical protein
MNVGLKEVPHHQASTPSNPPSNLLPPDDKTAAKKPPMLPKICKTNYQLFVDTNQPANHSRVVRNHSNVKANPTKIKKLIEAYGFCADTTLSPFQAAVKIDH